MIRFTSLSELRPALAAALLPVILFSTLQTLPAQDNNPEIAKISALLQQSDNAGALLEADEILAKDPNNCAILSLRAIALTRLDHINAALTGFTKAIALCPRYVPALEGAAEIEYSRSDPAAPRLLRRILAVNPSNLTAHAMLASFYRSKNECSAALPEFEASRPLFASHPQLMQGFGDCLVQKGNFREALAAYLEMSHSTPTRAIQYDVALLQWRTHSDDDALQTLEPLISSSYIPALELASRICEEQGDTPHAVALLRSAIVLEPKDLGDYLDFANIAFTHRSFQVGIDMLDSGITQLPDSAPLFIARGVLEVQLGNNDLAFADFEHAHQLDPKLSYVADALGMLQTQEHEGAAQSLEFFRTEARLHPNDAFLQYLLAEQLAQAYPDPGTVKGQKAVVAAKNSIRLDPSYTPAHDLLAMLYVKSHNFDLAIAEAEGALAQDPNDESALYQEILARRNMGDLQKAKDLIARLQVIREANAKKRQAADRYRLLDEAAP